MNDNKDKADFLIDLAQRSGAMVRSDVYSVQTITFTVQELVDFSESVVDAVSTAKDLV